MKLSLLALLLLNLTCCELQETLSQKISLETKDILAKVESIFDSFQTKNSNQESKNFGLSLEIENIEPSLIKKYSEEKVETLETPK